MAKDVVRNYRLTKQDADRLREKAEAAGMSESEYFRLLITQKANDYMKRYTQHHISLGKCKLKQLDSRTHLSEWPKAEG